MTDLHKIAVMNAALVAAGIVLLGVLTLIPATSYRVRALWRLMETEILIIAAVVSIFLVGILAIELAVVLIAFRVGFESAQVWTEAEEIPTARRSHFIWGASIGLAITTAAVIFLPAPFNLAAGPCLLVLLFSVVVLRAVGAERTAFALATACLTAYPGIAVFALALAAREPRCHIALLLAFMLTEVFDSFAVLGGRLLGRHALFPRLSPKKTLEGWLSGLAALLIVVGLLPLVVTMPSGIIWIAPATIAVAATAGDLLGSAPKRAAGVKDYPTILREHGGLLDILDAWLVTGPAFAAVWLFIG